MFGQKRKKGTEKNEWRKRQKQMTCRGKRKREKIDEMNGKKPQRV